ncbi:serine/arginine repetitive matrix protein 2-like isoform X2 [Thrips palmi]|nr:serine/arginine repetitive matrix protein 2-like isoform X2 [Thrips palmi]XP_034256141.1 serine/arginine repetitive matrix protein 2-like isoform X2 [Thrips palmi]
MRKPPPSEDQKLLLLSYMEKNCKFSQREFYSLDGKTTFQDDWLKLKKSLNDLPGANKSTAEWLKYWSDQRMAVKQRARQVYVHQNRGTGGGPPTELLTPYDQRLLACIGGWKRVRGVASIKDPLEIKLPKTKTAGSQSQTGSISHSSHPGRHSRSHSTYSRRRSRSHSRQSRRRSRSRSPNSRRHSMSHSTHSRRRSRSRSPHSRRRSRSHSPHSRRRSRSHSTHSRSRSHSTYSRRSSRSRSPHSRRRSRSHSPHSRRRSRSHSTHSRSRSHSTYSRRSSRSRSPHSRRSSRSHSPHSTRRSRSHSTHSRRRSRSRSTHSGVSSDWEQIPPELLVEVDVDDDGWEVMPPLADVVQPGTNISCL